jgi:hypothetical protein
MFDPKKNEMPQWEREYARVQHNAVFFIENFWNKLHPEDPIILTDEQKQVIYNKYRATPLVKDVVAYLDKLNELREKGYKDWEIDA